MKVSRFRVYQSFPESLEVSLEGSPIPGGARWEFFANVPHVGRALLFVDTRLPDFMRGRRGVGASAVVYGPVMTAAPADDQRPTYRKNGVELRAGFRNGRGMTPVLWSWFGKERPW